MVFWKTSEEKNKSSQHSLRGLLVAFDDSQNQAAQKKCSFCKIMIETTN